MPSSGLMNHVCYVLQFRLKPATDMDVKRLYTRRRDPVTGNCQELLCRVSQLSTTDNLIHSMRGAETTHRVYFVTNPELREENRLEINGLQYIILGVPLNASQANRLWQIDVKMITQQNERAEVIE